MEIRGLANQYPNYNNIISNIKGENNIFNGALQKMQGKLMCRKRGML